MTELSFATFCFDADTQVEFAGRDVFVTLATEREPFHLRNPRLDGSDHNDRDVLGRVYQPTFEHASYLVARAVHGARNRQAARELDAARGIGTLTEVDAARDEYAEASE